MQMQGLSVMRTGGASSLGSEACPEWRKGHNLRHEHRSAAQQVLSRHDAVTASPRPTGEIFQNGGKHYRQSLVLNGETIRLDGVVRLPPR